MTNVITAVTEGWTAVAEWYISTFQKIPELFYNAETGLTFVGTLAIFGGGLAIIIGLVNVIRSFVRAQ